MQKKTTLQKKIFVLDTNVSIIDPNAFMHMGEHDVVIPLAVIGEFDKLKIKKDSVAASARQASANLDAYFSPDLYKDGVSLGSGKGKLSIFIVRELHPEVRRIFKEDTPDNRIISAAMFVKEKVSREANKKRKQKKRVESTTVVFLSNDVNLRFKAGALGLDVEKYFNNAIDDVDLLYSGVETVGLNTELVAKIFNEEKVSYDEVRNFLGDRAPEPHPYEFFIIPGGEGKKTFSYFLDGYLYPIINGDKVYGSISPRNDEQRLAMNILLNPDINLVTLSGPAGTGKTLLAIGAAFQLINKSEKAFNQILITKPIVALSEKDNGFLPGDMIEKVQPYMQSLYDNVKFLSNSCKDVDKSKIEKLILDRERFSIEPLAYIRGRTYANTILIVDEAQNLSPLEVKTIVTRMGENSKIIFTGDIYQIDDKYLDSTNNGLTYLIEKAKDYKHAAHIDLVKGERSALAEWGGKNL